MPNQPYQIPSNTSMEASKQIMNQHMADTDQHVTTIEKLQWTYPNWDNLQNKPNFADSSWRGIFANRDSVVVSNVGDTFVVLNDGDGKGALYRTKSMTGDFAIDYEKLGDVDFATPSWDSILNKPILLLADGSVPMTGLLTLSGVPTQSNHASTKAYAESVKSNPALATVIETRTTDPTNPATGRIWIRTDL